MPSKLSSAFACLWCLWAAACGPTAKATTDRSPTPTVSVMDVPTSASEPEPSAAPKLPPVVYDAEAYFLAHQPERASSMFCTGSLLALPSRISCRDHDAEGFDALRKHRDLETLSIPRASEAQLKELSELPNLRALEVRSSLARPAVWQAFGHLDRLALQEVPAFRDPDELRGLSGLRRLHYQPLPSGSPAPFLHGLGHLKNLRELDLMMPDCPADTWRRLSGLPKLESLGLREVDAEHPLPPPAEVMPNITSLELSLHELDAAWLATLRRLPRLEELTVWWWSGTWSAVHSEALEKLPRLRRLSLVHGDMDEAGARGLGHLSLHHLELGMGHDVPPDVLASLPSLRGLHLSGGHAAGASKQLERVSYDNAYDENIAVLADHENLRVFTGRRAAGITNAGVEHMLEWTSLEYLELDEAINIGDALCKLTALASLKWVVVGNARGVSDACARRLGTELPNLEKLSLWGSEMTPATCAAINEARGRQVCSR